MKQNIFITCAVILFVTSTTAQDIPNRNLPFSPASSALGGARGGPAAHNCLDHAVKEVSEVKSALQLKELELENLKLKLELQKYQLYFASAMLRKDEGGMERAFPLRAAIWLNKKIPVYWENPTPDNEWGRKLVEQAVKRTWEKECGVEFTGWGKAEPDSKGIRMLIAEDGPHVKRLGRGLDGVKNGMVLNFSFQHWCPPCARDAKGSIEKIGIHEFGHALGFAHEQNRQDAPEWCKKERQGSDGDWYITLYDPDSIMNYCSSQWNNDGKLSPLDIQAARIIYGMPIKP